MATVEEVAQFLAGALWQSTGRETRVASYEPLDRVEVYLDDAGHGDASESVAVTLRPPGPALESPINDDLPPAIASVYDVVGDALHQLGLSWTARQDLTEVDDSAALISQLTESGGADVQINIEPRRRV